MSSGIGRHRLGFNAVCRQGVGDRLIAPVDQPCGLLTIAKDARGADDKNVVLAGYASGRASAGEESAKSLGRCRRERRAAGGEGDILANFGEANLRLAVLVMACARGKGSPGRSGSQVTGWPAWYTFQSIPS
jgi:hypothetical protein